MSFPELTERQKEIIGECLHAAANGPFFPDWEFHTLFGLVREEVASVAASWPQTHADEETIFLAINNALVNLIGYPIDSEEQWDSYISVPRAEVSRICSTLSRGIS